MSPVDHEEELDLARQSFAAGDADGMVRHLSTAIRTLTAQDRRREAAMACAELGLAYAHGLGNLTASRAWFVRAERLIADEPPCVEQGWVAVAAMGCDVDDPMVLLRRADLALDRARRFGDINLEAKALADGGLARVRLGRVDEGMELLDEAMALVCGPVDDVETASRSVCSFFSACYDSADFGRVGTWEPAIAARGLLAATPGGPVFLRSHCSSVRAALLCELGQWTEAERLYLDAIGEFESMMPSPAWHPAIGLADLRIRQGRFVESEQLLIGRAASIEALLPLARLHLARGEHELATATARRGLAALGHDRVRAVELLAIEIDATLASDDVAAARASADRLDQVVDGLDVPAAHARAGSARARLATAEGRMDVAIAHLQRSLRRIERQTLPWLRVLLEIELADLYDRAGRRGDAEVQLRSAAATLPELDAILPERHARVVERLGRGPVESTTRPSAVLRRGRSGWQAEHDGTRTTLTASKGVRYLAELIAHPGVERHVLDLVDRIEGVGEVDRRSLSDSGPVLDHAARTAYRRRIEELRGAIDEAMALEQLDRAEMLQAEIDQLVGELTSAFGIGGRVRRRGSAAERARLNVTRSLRTATARLVDALPDAGAALDRHLRTGLYCAYEPVDGEIRWIVQSEVNSTARD